MYNTQEKTSKRIVNYQSKHVEKIMLFDLITGGHHASYIQHILTYCYQINFTGNIDIVVSPQFLEIHRDTYNFIRNSSQKNIRIIPITQEELTNLDTQKSSWDKIWQEWKIFCKYAEKLQVNHALLMLFDYFQLPLSFGAKAPCSISGIYFRPTFHYNEFPNYLPSFQDKMRQLRQKLILIRVLKHQQLKTIFCLDQFAIKNIQKLNQRVKILYLADPVNNYEQSSIQSEIKLQAIHKRKELKISENRYIFLLFGNLDGRKGIHQVLEAVSILPDNIVEKISLLLIGKISSEDKHKIENSIQKLSSSSPIQIITCNEYIPENEVPVYFQMANIILTPHQQHIGMSGTILLAAAAQKPVLASNYALVGHLVETNQLGITVNTTSSRAIADGIAKFIETNPSKFYDSKKMQEFAEQHSHITFAKTLVNNLFTSNSESDK
jgi:glycosyltransferase involved in cell wall biosynthesis